MRDGIETVSGNEHDNIQCTQNEQQANHSNIHVASSDTVQNIQNSKLSRPIPLHAIDTTKQATRASPPATA